MMRHKGRFRKYFADYKFNSLFFRNLLMLAGLIIVPLTGAILISYYAYGNIQEKEQRAASEKLTADLFYDLKRIFKEAETELIYFGMNSDVELYLYDEAVNQYNYKIGTIQKLIKMPVIAKDYVDSVFIYSIKSSRVIMMEGVAKYESFSEKELIDDFLAQNTQKAMAISKDENGNDYRIIMFQRIKYGKYVNGVAAMTFHIKSLLKELNLPEDAQMYLTD